VRISQISSPLFASPKPNQKMNKGINVLSLFDGISCGRVALERAGIKVNKYFACEIDKYAITIAQANYPDTIQLGDVQFVTKETFGDNQIDLVIGGSPCQGFSFAGKNLNFDDPRSALFFEYVRLIKELKPKHFLLENVRMKQESKDVITKMLGVEPIAINSALVSAQTRNRLYWTNIPNVTVPADKYIGWGAIREQNVEPRFFYTVGGLNWISKHSLRKNKQLRVWKDDEKCQMIEASHFKNYSAQRFFGIMDYNMAEGQRALRYITPLECERAQTLPDNYTNHVSNTQRYKSIGNGWTVEVIKHIFINLNKS